MKKSIYFLLGFLLLLSACETIEDREGLGKLADKSELKISAGTTTTTKSGKKGNEIFAKNESTKIPGQFNFLVKTSTAPDDKAIVPFLGKLPISFIGTSAGGLVYDTIFVQVDTLDHPVHPWYANIAGTSVAGKTWVWAIDNKYTASHAIWGSGSAGNDSNPAWWQVGPPDAPAQGIDLNGSMTFDLNGAANFKRTQEGVTTKGSFSFDFTKKKTKSALGQITFTKTTILQGISQNDDKKVVYTFDIVKITDNELVLLYPTEKAPNNTGPEGFFWVFKRQGYVYP